MPAVQKLTLPEKIKITHLLDQEHSPSAVAKAYGISVPTVYRIKKQGDKGEFLTVQQRQLVMMDFMGTSNIQGVADEPETIAQSYHISIGAVHRIAKEESAKSQEQLDDEWSKAEGLT